MENAADLRSALIGVHRFKSCHSHSSPGVCVGDRRLALDQQTVGSIPTRTTSKHLSVSRRKGSCMLHWCSPDNHVGLSSDTERLYSVSGVSQRPAFKSQMEHHHAATNGIDEPSRLESGFLRGIPSLNLGRGVDVNKNFRTFISVWNNVLIGVGAISLVWLKRLAHNEFSVSSNLTWPIGKLAYNLLCGVGSTEVDTTGERNMRVPTSLRPEHSSEAAATDCRSV